MNDSLKTERDARRVRLVNLFTLPLAFLLVVMGFAMSQPTGAVRVETLVLLVFSVVFNLVTVRMISHGQGGRGLRLSRIYINLAVNIGLVYLLGRHWMPIWMILALTPVSAAIYGSRRHTSVACIQASAALLGVRLLYGNQSVMEWGHTFSHVLFVVAISFMINESMRTGDPSIH